MLYFLFQILLVHCWYKGKCLTLYISFVSCNLAVITYYLQESWFCFTVDSFQFSTQMIVSSVNQNNFISSLPICISFSFLVSLHQQWFPIQCWTDVVRGFCLISNLSGKPSGFLPLIMMLAVLFLLIIFIFDGLPLHS